MGLYHLPQRKALEDSVPLKRYCLTPAKYLVALNSWKTLNYKIVSKTWMKILNTIIHYFLLQKLNTPPELLLAPSGTDLYFCILLAVIVLLLLVLSNNCQL